MIPGNERRSFLLSITLTELALLMFFLLLLLAGRRVKDLLAENEGLKDDIEHELLDRFPESEKDSIAEYLRACSQSDYLPLRISVAEQRYEEATRARDSIRTALEAVTDSLELAQSELTEKYAEHEGLDSVIATIARADSASDDEVRELVRELAQEQGARAELARLLEERSSLLKEKEELEDALQRLENQDVVGMLVSVDSLNNEVANLRGQIANLARRCKPGFGLPPCWADAQGRPEYIFTVAFTDTEFSVYPNWPDHREENGGVDRVSGARSLLGTRMPEADFRGRARPVLEWSRQQSPECRHFVVIADSASDKAAFKSHLLTVEDFFYKYLPGN